MATTIHDLPEVLLSSIIAAVSDVRSRNSAALVCRKWLFLERATRPAVTLRGNLRDLFLVPTCFRSATHLDLSHLSPWGYSLSSSTSIATEPALLARALQRAFPNVTHLTLYARNASVIHVLTSQWENLEHVKLVRWHQRPQMDNTGDELKLLFQCCRNLTSLDLSTFYCWPDDVPPAIESCLSVATSLTRLNLLNPSFPEGFKSEEVVLITKCCPNLKEFRAACMFDPRYIGFVGDEPLVAVSVNCPKLEILHLAETSALLNTRGDPEDEGFTQEDVKISVATLIEVFSGLPLLEELTLDLRNNVRDSGPALEVLGKKCPRLRVLKLGQFHGISMPVEWKLDGVALCQGLESLSIRNVGDLTDMGLIAIARGCCRLAKFEVQGCKGITMRGMRTLASLLHRTLVDVKISCCKNLGAIESLKALEPVQHRIRRLHIDCVWDVVEELEDLESARGSFDLNHQLNGSLDSVQGGFDLNKLDQGVPTASIDYFTSSTDCDYGSTSKANKKCKYEYDLNCSYEGMDVNGNGYDNGDVNGFGDYKDANDLNCSYNGLNVDGNGHDHGYRSSKGSWESLEYLSLWIAVGQVLNPLPIVGLKNCPKLKEIWIKVEGDCRQFLKPPNCEFGLRVLKNYNRLSKMHLDCADAIGYAHTAPSGQMDLSLWERFFLLGIEHLSLTELDYWPPQDREVNQRSTSLPAVGLFQRCMHLRKLFVHGTTHEHFMMFWLNIPNLRDVQLREDYYPAPENDMSTEMRADSCSRFEAALNNRIISD